MKRSRLLDCIELRLQDWAAAGNRACEAARGGDGWLPAARRAGRRNAVCLFFCGLRGLPEQWGFHYLKESAGYVRFALFGLRRDRRKKP